MGDPIVRVWRESAWYQALPVIERLRARWWLIRHPIKTAAIRRYIREHPEETRDD